MALVGSTRTWTSGAALTRSLDRLARPGSRLERGEDRLGRLGDDAGVLGADDDAEAVGADAALLADRHLVAVACRPARAARRAPRSWPARSTVRSRRTIDPGAVRGPALLRRPGRVWKPVSPSPGTVVATSSTSGSASRIASAFAALLEDLLRAGAGRRRDRDLGDLLRARVDERGRQERHERQRRDEQRARRRRPCRPASSGCAGRSRIAGS